MFFCLLYFIWWSGIWIRKISLLFAFITSNVSYYITFYISLLPTYECSLEKGWRIERIFKSNLSSFVYFVYDTQQKHQKYEAWFISCAFWFDLWQDAGLHQAAAHGRRWARLLTGGVTPTRREPLNQAVQMVRSEPCANSGCFGDTDKKNHIPSSLVALHLHWKWNDDFY